MIGVNASGIERQNDRNNNQTSNDVRFWTRNLALDDSKQKLSQVRQLTKNTQRINGHNNLCNKQGGLMDVCDTCCRGHLPSNNTSRTFVTNAL